MSLWIDSDCDKHFKGGRLGHKAQKKSGNKNRKTNVSEKSSRITHADKNLHRKKNTKKNDCFLQDGRSYKEFVFKENDFEDFEDDRTDWERDWCDDPDWCPYCCVLRCCWRFPIQNYDEDSSDHSESD